MFLCAGWGIDSAVSGDRVVRNVEVAGVPIGGLDRDDVLAAAVQLDKELGAQQVVVMVGDDSIESTAADLGARVDAAALADAAFDARRGGFILAQPFRWAGTFFSTDTIDVPYTVDETIADEATATLIDTMLSTPIEPQFDVSATAISVIPGAEGATIADGELATALQAALEGGAPYKIELTPLPLLPDNDNETLNKIAEDATAATSNGRVFEVLDQTVTVEPAQLRSWVALTGLDTGTPDWELNEVLVMKDLATLFSNLGSADERARFDVVGGKPVIIPPSSSIVCCESDSPQIIRAALMGDTTANIVLQPDASDGAEAIAELEKLGIIEEVSTFTTKHNCCENRVTNIQRMADIVRGHVVKPGEQFSLNGFVGRRTLENGFLPAGAIADGVIEAQVGGGVSQFTTTIFNAVFFAGLHFDSYQSHSIYFSRYPYGREATVSFPAPDFKFTNDTEYGILIWPTYTDTSITVTLYSTKHITVEDIGRAESSQGSCTRVTTSRQLTYEDGTVKKDSVFAVYRPGEGLDCNGNPTKAATTTTLVPEPTTTIAEAEPTTTTPTTAAPTTAPATTTTTAETTTTTTSGG